MLRFIYITHCFGCLAIITKAIKTNYLHAEHFMMYCIFFFVENQITRSLRHRVTSVCAATRDQSNELISAANRQFFFTCLLHSTF